MARAQIIVRGGRDVVDQPMTHEGAPPARGQDIAVLAVIDGEKHLLPCTGFVLRCDGRKSIVTCNLVVDEVEITGVERVDVTDLVKTKHGVPRLTDDMIDTPAEVERLEQALRYIGANCEDAETTRDLVSRALRGKSLP